MNKVTGLFALTTLAFGIGSIYLLQALQLERERADELQDQISTSEIEAAMAPDPAMGSLSSITVTEAPPPDAMTPTVPATRNKGGDASEYSRRLANPAQRVAELAYIRLEIERRYPDLAASLNLRPEETVRLFDLLAMQELREREIEMKSGAEGPISDKAVAARRRQQEERRQSVAAEQMDLLGEAKMDEFNQYRQSLGARAQMRELRTMLAESNYMLRDDQFAPMVSELAAEQQRHQAEREKLYYGPGNPSRPTPQEVIEYMGRRRNLIEQSLQRRHDAAASHLDSEQLKRYDEMLDRERKRAQVEFDLFVTMNKEALKKN